MSFSSSNSDSSSTRLPSFGFSRGRGRGSNPRDPSQQAADIMRARSPLSNVRNSSRSRSRNRKSKRSGNDDYFTSLNPGAGSAGFHSPPILEDDDEQADILADQPALPSFSSKPDPSTPNDQRRRRIEQEMDDDAKDVFQTSIPRDDESYVSDGQIDRDIDPDTTNVSLASNAESKPHDNVVELQVPAAAVTAKKGPKVKFYNTSDDETTEDEDEDKVDRVTDTQQTKETDRMAQQQSSNENSSNTTLGNNAVNSSPPQEDDAKENNETFKDRFLKKMNMVLSEDDDIPDVPGEESLLARLMNLGDAGGLVPGATRAKPTKPEDEEQRIGNDIPLEDMGAEDLHDQAKGLIKGHEFYQNRSASSSTFNFYNPASTSFDDLDNYDINPLDGDSSYVDAPARVQQGVLSSLMKLYQNPANSYSSATMASSDTESVLSGQSAAFSGKSDSDAKNFKTRLKRFGSHARSASQSSLFHSDDETYISGKSKIGKPSQSISNLLHPNAAKSSKSKKHGAGEVENMPSFQSTRPKPKRKSKIMKSKRDATKAKITVHIADILQKQRFILRICKALMLYGAPTHRLEEYMMMTARVLEIDGQFIYFPGVMLVSFGDSATRTSDVKIVRCPQGLNLSKLHDVHKIYKAVVHDLMGVDEASTKLDELLARDSLYPPWMCVLLYGIGSAMVASWGFKGGWKDLPICFGIGLCVGFLQFYVAPRSSLYSNVFEVTSSIVVSFLGRAIGTINNGETFCFGGIVQSSLALILPGYIILCGSLELQSRNLVAGSVRMFYAIIYSLFLGFGITLGAALYGWIDESATSNTTCSVNNQLSPWWRMLFVPAFTVVLGLINQARLAQLPIMIFIAGLGYVVTYFAGKHFTNATEFTASMGAFVIGILGNLYSRIGRGMAVSAMLPAIFVQVPSGIASQSSLLSGVETADNIVNNSTTSSSDASSLSFGVTMVEVAIGISVGLFAAAIVVYPLGKKRTGLFTL